MGDGIDADEFDYFDVYIISIGAWYFLGVFETEKIDSLLGGNNQWLSGLHVNEAGLWETAPRYLPRGGIAHFVESDKEGFVRYRKDMGLAF